MPRVEQVAGELNGAAAGIWNGIPLSCHVATLIWLHHAQTGALPAGPLAIPKLINFRTIIQQIVARGRPLQAAWQQVVQVAPGSILVFSDDAGEPGHSCTATTDTILIGYNQTGWFRSPGVAADFSIHFTSDIRWLGPPFPTGRVTGQHDRVYWLTATDGETAKGVYQNA
jgi:hypothetical protein